MTRSQQKRDLELTGEPFALGVSITGFDNVVHDPEFAAIAELDGYGRRIVKVRFANDGRPSAAKVKNCIHGRPIRGRFVNASAYAQICRLCVFEVERLEASG